MANYVRKTKDVWCIKANFNYGDGWEEIDRFDSYTETKRCMQEYDAAYHGSADLMIVKRRKRL